MRNQRKVRVRMRFTFNKIKVVILGNKQLPLSIRRHYSAKAHVQDYNTTRCRYYTILSLNLHTITEELLKAANKIYT